MSHKVIELKPNRNLLNINFESYKLSLEPVPVIKQSLTSKPDQTIPSDSQYSFLHAQIFGLQNHLVRDSWSRGSAYFIDENWNVQKVNVNPISNRLESITSVYSIPRERPREAGDYNLTFKFISLDYCALSDGIGNLLLLETRDRTSSEKWKLALSIKQGDYGFIVEDGRLDNNDEITVLLHHIEQDKEMKFVSILNWIKFTKSENVWQQFSQKQLKSRGSLLYASLEAGSKDILTITDQHKLNFILDTENPIQISVELNGNKSDPPEVNNWKFEWEQTDDLIMITFDCVKGLEANLSDYSIEFDEKRVKVTYNETILLNEELFDDFEVDSFQKEITVS